MQGIEIVYADICIHSLVSAFTELLQDDICRAVPVCEYGKSDTKGFDAIMENEIRMQISGFDRSVLFVTEETDGIKPCDWPLDNRRTHLPGLFVSDPVDRSKYFKELLLKLAGTGGNNRSKVGELLADRNEVISLWENEIAEGPATVTGATSAISYINRGKVIFSVILNLITREIYVACEIDCCSLELPSDLCGIPKQGALQYVLSNGKRIIFPSIGQKRRCEDDQIRFVTFLGKDMYREIFEASGIITVEPSRLLHHREPGGPSRILYLSDRQTAENPIGFILSNGEKIGEWIHWLPYIKYSRNLKGNQALRLYEVSLKSVIHKENIPVSPSKYHSVFKLGTPDGDYLDVSQIKVIDTPSKFRSTLVVAPEDNKKVCHIMARHKYRDVTGCL